MNDENTSVAELRREVKKFVDERDWAQFHNPKNLSMSIAIEAAELMEHFQWLGGQAADEVRSSQKEMEQVREELSDVLCFLLSFANAMEIDVTTALRDKMVKNARKYPAEQFRGKFR